MSVSAPSPSSSSPSSPQAYVAEKAAAAGSSFTLTFRFLPPAGQAAITAFYVFCREVDDVVDEVSDPGVAATKLAWWRKEVAAAYEGRPTHPVMKALMPYAAEFAITAWQLQQIIDGCEMDLAQSRYLDFPGLARYCHLVAGVVGEVSANIFGRRNGSQTSSATTAYAHTLGLAFQLTNIIRDVGDDARRGRIYLPVNELQQFGVKAAELLKAPSQEGYSDRFVALMRFQAERAHRTYDEALALLPASERKAQKPGLMMAAIYRDLLREVERHEFRVLHQRVQLTPLRKAWLALRVQLTGRP